MDAVYCNALDHAFDLERMVGEVVRVLALVARIADARKLAVETTRELGETSRGRRRLVGFRKPR